MKRGFTIIELLVIISIISILFTFSISYLLGSSSKNKDSEVKVTLLNVLNIAYDQYNKKGEYYGVNYSICLNKYTLKALESSENNYMNESGSGYLKRDENSWCYSEKNKYSIIVKGNENQYCINQTNELKEYTGNNIKTFTQNKTDPCK